MDLAELGIVFTTEGADAAISKMESFKDASIELVLSKEDQIKADAKVTASTNSLSESITRSILAYTGSKAAQYEFQAMLLGSNEGIAKQIEMLRELETMDKLATQTAKDLSAELRAEEGALLDLARDIQNLNKVKAQEAAESEARRKAELASRDAYYAEVVAKAKKAEQDITDARHKAIIDAQDATAKAAAMYTKDEQDRVKAAAKADKDIAASKKQAADAATKTAEQQAIAEINWAKKSRDEQIRIKKEIEVYSKAGVGNETLGKMFGSGALNGTVKEVEDLAQKWHHVTLNTSRARSEMVVLAHEAVQGRFSRIPASMMVFAEYTDLTSLALSGMGLAIMGTVAAIAGLSIAMVKGLLEQRELQNALIMTGNYAGTTEGQLNLLAHTSTAMGGSIGVAKDVILQLAASGKFTGDQIDSIVPAIVRMEDATGGGKEAVAKLVGEFKSLAVEANAHSRYSDEVSKAVLKLDNEYHFLTASVFAQIRAFEAEGQTKEASKLATEEFAKVTNTRAKEIYDNLGTIEKGWRHIKEAIGEAWSAMKDWGKTDTLQGKLEAAAKKIEDLADPTLKIGHQTINFGTDHRRELQAQALKEYNVVVGEYLEQQKKVNKEAENSRTQNAANHAISEVTLSDQQMKADKMGLLATKQAEYNAQIARMKEGLATAKPGEDTSKLEALLTDEAIAKHRAGLEKLYGEKSKAAKEYSTKAMDQRIAEYNLEYQSEAKHTDKMVAERQRMYTATMQIESDKFAMAKSKAATESDLGLAPVELYIAYYDTVKAEASKLADSQRELYDRQAAEAGENTAKVIAELTAQVTATKRGEEDKAAAILQARAKLKAELAKLSDKVAGVGEQETRAGQVAEAEMLKQLSVSRDKAIEQLEKKIAKEEKQIQLLKLGEEGVARLAAKQDEAAMKNLEDSLAILQVDRTLADGQEAKVKLYDIEIERVTKLIALRKKDKATSEDLADSTKEADRIKAVEAAWKSSWESTNKVAQDVFVTWVEGGEDMAQKVGKMLKKSLLEAIYNEKLKPLVLDVFMNFMGGGGKAGQAVLSGMGKSGGGGDKDALGSMGDLGSIFGMGSMGGAFGAGASWLTGGGSFMGSLTAGSSLIGTGSMAGMMSGFSMLAGTLLPVVAGLAIVSKAMDYKIDAKGNALTATMSGTGLPSGQVGTRADFTQTGGLFGGGTTQNSTWGVADAGTTGYIDSQLKSVTAASTAYGKILGLNTEALANFTKSVSIDITGMDSAAAQAAIDKEIALFASEQIDAAFGDSVKSFALAGETSAETIARLATDVTFVNSVLGSFGGAMMEVGSAAASGASTIVSAMGGLQAMAATVAQMQQDYYTSTEQRQMTADQISQTLNGAGLNFTSEQILAGTRQDGRNAIDQAQRAVAADPTSATAQAQYVAVMKVSKAYATLNPTIDQANDALAKQKAATQAAAQAIGGGGGGGGGSSGGGKSLVSALQGLIDAIVKEVQRIRGLISGTGVEGYAAAQAKFGITTAQARAGDQTALGLLPEMSQNMLTMAEANVSTLAELKLIQAMTAQSLQDTATMVAASNGLTIPAFADGTNMLPQDMIALVHRGEAIVPAAYNPANGYSGGGGMDTTEIVKELRATRLENAGLRQDISRIKDILTRVSPRGDALDTRTVG